MKRLIVVCITVCLMLTGAYVPFANAQQLKIGVVDLIKALNESDAGKRARTDLETMLKSKETAIEDKKKGIDKLKSDLEKQASIMSADARKSKEAELERLVRDYQRMVADSQAEFKKLENELTDEIMKDIFTVIAKLGDEKGYDLILPDGSTLYKGKAVDITDLVIKKLNELKAQKPASSTTAEDTKKTSEDKKTKK